MVWPFSKKKTETKQDPIEKERLEHASTHFKTQRAALEKLRARKDEIFGVKIVRCNCDPSIKLMDNVYMFGSNIPRIPLTNCPNPERCKCEYLGLSDQRVIPDRRDGHDRRGAMRVENERRKNHGRRTSDASSWDKHEKL